MDTTQNIFASTMGGADEYEQAKISGLSGYLFPMAQGENWRRFGWALLVAFLVTLVLIGLFAIIYGIGNAVGLPIWVMAIVAFIVNISANMFALNLYEKWRGCHFKVEST
jgi:hypothetical protein